MMVAFGWASSNGMRTAVIRNAPTRLMVRVCSAIARSSIPDFKFSELLLTSCLVHPHAAGIDIGNASQYVAVPPSHDPQPVRCFGCTTAELRKMAEWLRQCGIRTVCAKADKTRRLNCACQDCCPPYRLNRSHRTDSISL